MGRSFEQIELSATIHAAEFMAGDDGNDRRNPVAEWEKACGFPMGERARVDERSALAERAMGLATLVVSRNPEKHTRTKAENEYLHRHGGGI